MSVLDPGKEISKMKKKEGGEEAWCLGKKKINIPYHYKLWGMVWALLLFCKVESSHSASSRAI